ncbi:unnamed protein product [Lactuca saligna]|uniref:Uncharacterized protein n=1 Tax=Lactuca saligna TaxID=75948 RepID=A0AA35YGG0_LACSI|nr:unnamed protein product [Lactuca saligna]
MDEYKKAVAFGVVQIDGNMAGREGHSKEKPGSYPVPERNRLESPGKTNWQVVAFGFGSTRFPRKMKLSDIKSRQQTSTTIADGGEVGSDRRKKRWWRLIDVFRCGGGYDGDMVVNDMRASFPTLKKFD